MKHLYCFSQGGRQRPPFSFIVGENFIGESVGRKEATKKAAPDSGAAFFVE